MNDTKLNRILIGLLFTFVFYCGVATAVFRYQNPTLTETQIFLNFWNIITWNF